MKNLQNAIEIKHLKNLSTFRFILVSKIHSEFPQHLFIYLFVYLLLFPQFL